MHRFSSVGAEEMVELAEHPPGAGSQPGPQPGGSRGSICRDWSLKEPRGGGWLLSDSHDKQKASMA